MILHGKQFQLILMLNFEGIILINIYTITRVFIIIINHYRIDKICIRTNTITTIIATDNWLLKVTPYNMFCAHQSDTALIVCSSDTHHCSMTNRNSVQFINIEVKSTRADVEPFFIRLNGLDFQDLQDKWARPIVVLPNVVFHATLLDRFIDAFKEQIKLNQVYETNQVYIFYIKELYSYFKNV